MSAPASAAAPVDVAELRRQANEQGEVVKALKKELKDNSAAKDDPRLKEALAKLMAIKAALDTAILGDPAEIARLQAAKKAKEAEMAWRQTLEAVIAQRGFFFRSNEIHPNAPSGFYDFGPNGCAVKQNLLQLWRNWFVLHESMLEIEVRHSDARRARIGQRVASAQRWFSHQVCAVCMSPLRCCSAQR